ncbi:MAG TPA: acyltransferase [Xanthomonadales bacterium]|nr:acyltransferase [Xanthomonadales bacterium]
MLINVQFLRFAAAMLVVFYHTSSHVRDAGVDQGALFAVSQALGFAGVDVFFVISGFIMAYTTGSAAGWQASWTFARRRVARIYSGYWSFFLFAWVLFAWVNPDFLATTNLARSALLWPANHLLIGVSWTLICEMFFYLLYTLLMLCAEVERKLLLKLLLGFIIAWSVYSQFFRHAFDPGHLEYISLAEYYTLSPYLAEFLAGAIVAGWLRQDTGKHGWTWLVSGCLLFLLAGWINNNLFAGEIEQGYYVFYRVAAFGTPSLLILIGLVRLEQAGMRTPARFSILVGGASYAIYLSHTLLLTTSQHFGFNTFAGSLAAPLAQILFFALAALILAYSVMHYQFLERPLHGWFKRALRIC